MIGMESELKKIHLGRSLVFQDMALVEISMNGLISLHFLGNSMDEDFTSQMLQHPYFSFELRKRIFSTIFKKRYADLIFPWSDLNRMQELRNIIAHGRIDKIGQYGKDTFFYSYHSEKIECDALHLEFQKHMDEVVKTLNKISIDTNITYKPETPMEQL